MAGDFIGADNSAMDHLVADLAGAGARAALAIVPVLNKAGLNVKTEAAALAPKGPRTRAYPHSITYDVDTGGTKGVLAVEIGPDKDLPQGALGNLLEFGTATLPPKAHLLPAFEHEKPRFEEAAQTALIGSVWHA